MQGQIKPTPCLLFIFKNIKNCHTEMIDVTVFIYLLISGLTCLPKSTAIIIFAQSSAM